MQQPPKRVANPERKARTRGALIAAARELFMAKGFAATGTPEIVARAGLTRGALYHHFADKQALFAAVVEAENAAVGAAIEAAAVEAAAIEAAAVEPGSVLEALRLGAAAYLSAMRAPGRTALLLLEGPAVLGPQASAASDARHARCSLSEGLAAAVAQGAIPPVPVEALSEVLGAAFDGAALALHRGRPEAEVTAAILALIDGLNRRRTGCGPAGGPNPLSR